jgi:hypothetical protein
MSGAGQTAPDVAPAPARTEPVDASLDLSRFQDMLVQEIREDWRPNEWDSRTWIFTGVPGHLGTLVNGCNFPDAPVPHSPAAADCATSALAATSGTPSAWAP